MTIHRPRRSIPPIASDASLKKRIVTGTLRGASAVQPGFGGWLDKLSARNRALRPIRHLARHYDNSRFFQHLG
jgi:hypothetical protein